MADIEQTEPFAAEVARIRQVYAARSDSSRYSEVGHRLAVEERCRRLRDILTERGYASLTHTRILDVGCGIGDWLRQFLDWGARPENLCGMDLLPDRIAQAKALCPPAVTLVCQNATRIPATDSAYDLVLQSTVFSSILDPEMKRQIAREMLRVLSARGLILWYDLCADNPRNLDVRGVDREEISRLFRGCQIRLEKLTLAPPLGRMAARLSPSLYRLLSGAGMLRTHYLGTISRA